MEYIQLEEEDLVFEDLQVLENPSKFTPLQIGLSAFALQYWVEGDQISLQTICIALNKSIERILKVNDDITISKLISSLECLSHSSNQLFCFHRRYQIAELCGNSISKVFLFCKNPKIKVFLCQFLKEKVIGSDSLNKQIYLNTNQDIFNKLILIFSIIKIPTDVKMIIRNYLIEPFQDIKQILIKNGMVNCMLDERNNHISSEKLYLDVISLLQEKN